MSAERQRLRLALLRLFGALSKPLRRSAPPTSSSNPRILLIRPDHIGDLLFATPAIRALRVALPDAHLTCLVGPWGEAVLQDNPHLDEIRVCPFPGFTRQHKGSWLAPYRTLWEWANGLRAARFDLAVVLRFDHWWGALLAYMAGIPVRVGYDIAECQPFSTDAPPYVSSRHEVVQNLTLVQHALSRFRGGANTAAAASPLAAPLQFAVQQEDREWVERYLAEQGVVPGDQLIAIHPGAGAAVKLWRNEAWAQVAGALVERWPLRAVITGSRRELDLAWSVYAGMKGEAVVAAGATTLGQLAALFERCQLVLGPDCGPVHLAVAVGTPTVHLYGPVDALKFGPWGDARLFLVVVSRRDCVPCDRLDYHASELPSHPCVREIGVEAVLAAAKLLLARSRSAAGSIIPQSRR
jgi:ADP-heptose:LPS heptosyltransferase